MPFKHNSTGVNPDGGFTPLPEGDYILVIKDATEKMSKKGLPMVECDLEVIENVEFHGKGFKHYVVFIAKGEKGDGINVHFRKCIGVPWEGDVEVNADDWVGKKLRASLKIESRVYEGKNFTGNKVVSVAPYGEKFPEIKPAEEVPF